MRAGFGDALWHFNTRPREIAELYNSLEPVKNTVDEIAQTIQGKTPDDPRFTSMPNSTERSSEFMIER